MLRSVSSLFLCGVGFRTVVHVYCVSVLEKFGKHDANITSVCLQFVIKIGIRILELF